MVRAGTAFLGALLVAVLPFAARGALGNMWLAFGSFYERRDTMSAFAANIGWIINWALRSWLSVPQRGWAAFLQVVPRPLAISRFREVGWAMWIARHVRDLAVAAALGAFTVHAFFVLNVGAHENHQLLEIPLLVLAAGLRPGFRPLLVAVSAIVALNINFYYGISLGWGWAVPRRITGLDISVVLAFANVTVLVWFARRFSKEVLLGNETPIDRVSVKTLATGSL